MSLPEAILWRELRKRPGGFKFRRQHPIDSYVVDFFCGQARLAVEIDGAAHDGERAAAHDERRDEALGRKCVRMLRVPAADVLRDVGDVVSLILAQAASPLHHASHGPPPLSGEDL